ncbi:MAG TPA: response regulator [Clostridiales bacterium]|nr:response regulator [Clostridiales bacterium]
MRFMIVDDEERARHLLEMFLHQRDDAEDIAVFDQSPDALAYASSQPVDIAFLDIEMPQLNGIDLATKFLALKHVPAVIFITGYSQYALAAWDVEAVDFIVKPFGAEDVNHGIARAVKISNLNPRQRVEIHCFPSFQLLVDGVPVPVQHKKSTELLAYLVHHRGAWVTMNDAVAALFEDKNGEKAKNYFRLILYRLKRMLAEYGIDDLLMTKPGCLRVDPHRFSCDYYSYLNGEGNLFHGEYLTEYAWAEFTVGSLANR